jgi:hypothetical protein
MFFYSKLRQHFLRQEIAALGGRGCGEEIRSASDGHLLGWGAEPYVAVDEVAFPIYRGISLYTRPVWPMGALSSLVAIYS